MVMPYHLREGVVHLILIAIWSLVLAMPTFARGQSSAYVPMHQPVFESLKDNQWVRVASLDLGRRQGRLLQRDSSDLILSPTREPLRIPAVTIDTLWTRGYSTKRGAIVGALLGAGLGALAAGSLGERDTDRNALWAVSLGGGTVGGALLGALIGTALPRWKRRFP